MLRLPNMPTPLWLAATLVCWLLAGNTLRAQQQITDLKKPVALTMHQGNGYAYFVEEGIDRLTRWDGERVEPVVASLSKGPTQLSKVVGTAVRDRNCVTLVGYGRDDAKTSRVVTYRIGADDALKFDAGLSGDLLLGERSRSITAMTSTDLAIHFATTVSIAGINASEEPQLAADSEVSLLYELPTGKTTLGKPRVIRRIDGAITALSMNVQGHIVAATQGPADKLSIQFFQVSTGRPLVRIECDMQSITSLDFEPKTHALYATGSKNDQDGVYRLDVMFDGTVQRIRGSLVAAIRDAKSIVFSEQRALVMVSVGDSGRLVSVEVE